MRRMKALGRDPEMKVRNFMDSESSASFKAGTSTEDEVASYLEVDPITVTLVSLAMKIEALEARIIVLEAA